MSRITTLLILTLAFGFFPVKTAGSRKSKSIGLIVLRRQGYVRPGFIQIYNEDGSLWHKFSLYYDDSDGKFDYANGAFDRSRFIPIISF